MEPVSPGGPCFAYRRGTLFLATDDTLRNALPACGLCCCCPHPMRFEGESLTLLSSPVVSPDPFERGHPATPQNSARRYDERTLAADAAQGSRVSACPRSTLAPVGGVRRRLAHRPARTPPRRPSAARVRRLWRRERRGAWGSAPGALRSVFRPASSASLRAAGSPRSRPSVCTPGLADGQGFSAALRCAKTQSKEQ